ncbi:hypothetical protein TRFO_22763 [Tritrichomonas foetus]|uniref:Uncharacterized protein n=1 Tax=Tritrichomonas foetus TaxID=1144522 RepID=A0A1J4KB80_9EUKA|nr:hypothetical protein TRFO_22763 [Tritrichomonas foetus]|eukprot:OHT08673.1 hypothetical protein TRFO_22763 [Tritrichomonas foetus]
MSIDIAKQAIDNDNVFLLEHAPQIDLLISTHMTIQEKINDYRSSYKQLIQYAASKGKIKCFRFLYKKYLQIFNNLNSIFLPGRRDNILSLCVESNSLECLKYLIQATKILEPNFSFDVEDDFGQTPLYVAATNKNIEAIEILLDAGANILHESTKQKFIIIPFLIVCFWNNKDDIKIITSREDVKKQLEGFQEMKLNKNSMNVVHDESTPSDDIVSLMDFLGEKGITNARDALIETIVQIENVQSKATTIIEGVTDEPEESEKVPKNNKCSADKCDVKTGLNQCPYCMMMFCENHIEPSMHPCS